MAIWSFCVAFHLVGFSDIITYHLIPNIKGMFYQQVKPFEYVIKDMLNIEYIYPKLIKLHYAKNEVFN